MRFCLSAVLCFSLIFTGCALAGQAGHSRGYSISTAEKAADTAMTLLGKPYRYGGDTADGLDCSGLIKYSYRAAGIELPHNTSVLRQQSRPIRFRDMRRGDLVFFNQLGKKYSHVGIAVGGSHFVHAPSSGKSVRMDSLEDPYWKKHFLGARRL